MDSKEEVLKNEEGRMKTEEIGVDAAVKERLSLISNSIKAVGALTGAGITYCVILPGDQEDGRLSSCCIAKEDGIDGQQIIQQLCGNIVSILGGFMQSLLKAGLSDSEIRNILREIVKDAERIYEESNEGERS